MRMSREQITADLDDPNRPKAGPSILEALKALSKVKAPPMPSAPAPRMPGKLPAQQFQPQRTDYAKSIWELLQSGRA